MWSVQPLMDEESGEIILKAGAQISDKVLRPTPRTSAMIISLVFIDIFLLLSSPDCFPIILYHTFILPELQALIGNIWVFAVLLRGYFDVNFEKKEKFSFFFQFFRFYVCK